MLVYVVLRSACYDFRTCHPQLILILARRKYKCLNHQAASSTAAYELSAVDKARCGSARKY